MHESTTKEERLLIQPRQLVYPVSFRLDASNWDRLQLLLDKINSGRVKKVNLTHLIKALIYQGQYLSKAEWDRALRK